MKLTQVLGHICVTVLRTLRRLPLSWTKYLLSILLPLYPLIRPKHSQKLRSLFQQFEKYDLNLKTYYQARLKLFLTNLKLHGKEPHLAHLRVKGLTHYQNALTQQRPILLLGIHQGVFELLHKLPPKAEGNPFLILTAPAFATSLSRFMAQGRELGGKRVLWDRKHRLVPTQDGLAFEHGLRQVISENGTLAMMADQLRANANQTENHNTIILFEKFKLPISLKFLKYLVDKKFQILPVTTYQATNEKTEFEFHLPWEINGELDNKNLEDAIRNELVKFMEASITKAPAQWNWSYPRITGIRKEPSQHLRRVF